jgi:multicomponent Na+:H+ antiporter subunit D
LAGAVLAPLAGRISARLPVIVAVVALAAPTGLMAVMAPSVYRGHQLTHYMGHWLPVAGSALGVAFSADAWGLTFALAVSGVGVLLALFTLSGQADLGARELGSLTCLILLLEAALIGVGLTGDAINLFVWFEVAALASYGLTSFFLERPFALEAAFKMLVLTNVAAFAVFLGVSFLYTNHGGLNLGQLQGSLASHPQTVDLVALALLIAGFATKAGLVPFHGWLPDAHTAAPAPVSALFSGLMVSLGIVAIGRLIFEVYRPATIRPVLGLLMGLGLVSAVGGALFALFQDDLKRLLAYDTISQMGILAVGLATGTASGVEGASYHLVNQALFKSLLFLCAGAIVHATGLTKLSEMGGLARRYPALAAGFVVGVVAIAGIPPMNGYVSVGLIHDALRESGQTVPWLIVVVAQLITVAALARAGWLAFFRHPVDTRRADPQALRPGMVIALGALMVACVAFGVVPTVGLDHVFAPAAGALLAGGRYGRNLLSGRGTLPSAPVSFDYFRGSEWATVFVATTLAVPLAFWAQRVAESKAVQRLRSVQTGSVNDYAGYLVVGFLFVVAVLTLAA